MELRITFTGKQIAEALVRYATVEMDVPPRLLEERTVSFECRGSGSEMRGTLIVDPARAALAEVRRREAAVAALVEVAESALLLTVMLHAGFKHDGPWRECHCATASLYRKSEAALRAIGDAGAGEETR